MELPELLASIPPRIDPCNRGLAVDAECGAGVPGIDPPAPVRVPAPVPAIDPPKPVQVLPDRAAPAVVPPVSAPVSAPVAPPVSKPLPPLPPPVVGDVPPAGEKRTVTVKPQPNTPLPPKPARKDPAMLLTVTRKVPTLCNRCKCTAPADTVMAVDSKGGFMHPECATVAKPDATAKPAPAPAAKPAAAPPPAAPPAPEPVDPARVTAQPWPHGYERRDELAYSATCPVCGKTAKGNDKGKLDAAMAKHAAAHAAAPAEVRPFAEAPATPPPRESEPAPAPVAESTPAADPAPLAAPAPMAATVAALAAVGLTAEPSDGVLKVAGPEREWRCEYCRQPVRPWLAYRAEYQRAAKSGGMVPYPVPQMFNADGCMVHTTCHAAEYEYAEPAGPPAPRCYHCATRPDASKGDGPWMEDADGWTVHVSCHAEQHAYSEPAGPAYDPVAALVDAPATANETAPAAMPGFRVAAELAELRRAAALVAATADPKATLPVLAAAHIAVDSSGYARMTATDLTTWTMVDFGARCDGSGAYAVPAKVLQKSLPKGKGDGMATLSYNGNAHMDLETSGASLRLQGLPAVEYPRIPTAPARLHYVDREDLHFMLDSTVHAVAQDESRYHLCGALLKYERGELVCVASDGHRLALTRLDIPQATIGEKNIVPRKGVQVLIRALAASKAPKVGIAVEGGMFWARTAELTVGVKMIEAEFPPYEMVIPTQADRTVTVDSAKLVDALKQVCSVAKVARGWTAPIKLATDRESGMLHVTADNPDAGQASADVPANLSDPGDYEIGFNGMYMLDWLESHTCNAVVLELSSALDPMLMHPEGSKATIGVLMPMRI